MRNIFWHNNTPGKAVDLLEIQTAGSDYPVRHLPFLNSSHIATQDDDYEWVVNDVGMADRLKEIASEILSVNALMLDLEDFSPEHNNNLRQRIPLHWVITDYIHSLFPDIHVGWFAMPHHKIKHSLRWQYIDIHQPPAKYFNRPNALFLKGADLSDEKYMQYMLDVYMIAPHIIAPAYYIYIDSVEDSKPIPAKETIKILKRITQLNLASQIVVRGAGKPLEQTLITVRDWIKKYTNPIL